MSNQYVTGNADLDRSLINYLTIPDILSVVLLSKTIRDNLFTVEFIQLLKKLVNTHNGLLVFYTTEWAYNHKQNFLLDFYKTNPNYRDDYNDYIIKLLCIKIDLFVVDYLFAKKFYVGQPIQSKYIKEIYDKNQDEMIQSLSINKSINNKPKNNKPKNDNYQEQVIKVDCMEQSYQFEYDQNHIMKAYMINYKNLPSSDIEVDYIIKICKKHIDYGTNIPTTYIYKYNVRHEAVKLFEHAFKNNQISSLESLFAINKSAVMSEHHDYYIRIIESGINSACTFGYASILEWIKCNMPSCTTYCYVKKRHLYSAKTTVFGLDDNLERAISLACSYGQTSILDWYYYRYKFRHSTKAIDNACENGHVSILDWFLEHPDLKFIYTEAAINKASLNGHTQILDWFKTHNIPFKYNLNTIKAACLNKYNLHVKKWYQENRIRKLNSTKLHLVSIS